MFTEEDRARFLAKIAPGRLEECWPWQACDNGAGYGRLRIGRRTVSATRLSYQIFKGDIPPGRHVLHTCDNPQCVNPHHLYLGDAKRNMQDYLDRHCEDGLPPRRGHGRLRREDVPVIRQRYAQGERMPALAQEYGVDKTTISQCVRGKVWPDLGGPISRDNKPTGEAKATSKLTAEKVREIRRRYAAGGVTCRQLAEEYGVSFGLVNGVIKRKRWEHIE